MLTSVDKLGSDEGEPRRFSRGAYLLRVTSTVGFELARHVLAEDDLGRRSVPPGFVETSEDVPPEESSRISETSAVCGRNAVRLAR